MDKALASADHLATNVEGNSDSDAAAPEAAALELLGEVERRLGRPVSLFEWRVLNGNGAHTAAELNPVEAELLVRLAAGLGSAIDLDNLPCQRWLDRYLRPCRNELTAPARRWPVDAFSLAVVAGLVFNAMVMLVAGLAVDPMGTLVALRPGAVLMGMTALFVLLSGSLIHRQRMHILNIVEKELPKSNILERLAENDPTLDDIKQNTPAPFNWLFLGFDPPDMRGRAKLVRENLDWYLQPKTGYVRAHWLFRANSSLITIGLPFLLSLPFLLPMQPFFPSVVILIGGWMLTAGGKQRLERYFAASLIEKLMSRVGQRLSERSPSEA